ncbi:carboxypeptidase-like regulatory domain-containing protein [Patulibacter minatonensis]|uniref:carboxypeptidase-like regulatory domain-containing protein n=1 Tax=Patulibacter minatonensis TaxID=298163 RepID=UPI00047CADD6|nr:carboxypeptidase-like regulatory domain-containing protein [Patulibacter minatonensis]
MSARRTPVGRLILLLVVLVGVVVPGTASAAPPTGTLVGHVVDDLGRPVADASVHVAATQAPWPSGYDPVVASTRTDALGRYVAPDVPARDDYVLRASKDGYASAESHPAGTRLQTRTFSVGAGQTVTEDLAIVELSVTIRGRVVDFSGAGIAGATTPFGPADRTGAFSGRVFPGDVVMTASADDYLPLREGGTPWEDRVVVRTEHGQTVDGVLLRLRRVPTEDCWGQDGSWTPAGGHRDVRDADGNWTQVVAATPPAFPYAEHLCVDTDDRPYRGAVEAPARVGVPMAPLPRPAAAKPLAAPRPATVGVGTLRGPSRVRAARGAFAVTTSCSASCGGRVVAVARRAGTRGRRAADVVVASGNVAPGTGTRPVRLRLTGAGRRAVAATRSGVVVTLRWTVPGAGGRSSTGPRVRVMPAR